MTKHTVTLTSLQMLEILVALGNSATLDREAGFKKLAQDAEDLRRALQIGWYPLLDAARGVA